MNVFAGECGCHHGRELIGSAGENGTAQGRKCSRMLGFIGRVARIGNPNTNYWLVNKAKVEPKTVQAILRHSKIQTKLDLYTQEDSDETRAAQGEFLSAVGMTTTVP
jgi:hypothetical protein